MTITGPLVLPPDVMLTPVADLSNELRKQFRAEEGDVAVTRLRSRTPSKIVDAQVAALINQFREPRTIVEAVINYCRANLLEPERTLEEALPVLEHFIRARVLVMLGSEDASRITATYPIGAVIADMTVIRCVQVLEDSELYKVETTNNQHAALKIARSGHIEALSRAIAREADVLRRLDGIVNAPALAKGVFQDRPYLVTGWCPGLTADSAANSLRHLHGFGAPGWGTLRDLSAAIADAYAHLHQQGLIHGDVHPRNVLVDPSGAIKIVDFGLARFEETTPVLGDVYRGGVGYFFEPEFASARARRSTPPQATFLGEQYSLAAMIYMLISGVHYIDFSAEKREMMRQIAEDPPLPFRGSGKGWPGLERILARALRKNPSERFRSLSEFAGVLRNVDGPPSTQVTMATEPPVDHSAAAALVNRVLERVVAPDGQLFTRGLAAPPFSSVNYGMAGIAYALCRFARQRDDTHLLTSADLWVTRAAARMGTDAAFYSADLKITPATVGQIALYHTATGVEVVRAIIAHAMCDVVSQQTAVREFVAAAQHQCDCLDLTLGKASILIGCSLLAELPIQADWLDIQPLLTLGDKVLGQLWFELDAMPPIGDETGLRVLGIAHGWAGILYATLRWCHSAQRPLPNRTEERLRQLAARAELTDRGARWRIKLPKSSQRQLGAASDYMNGWCNGTGGHIFLWTLASQFLGDDSFAELAERAAWDAWDQANEFDSLCCGLAGSAYGLFSVYRQTGDQIWLRRAKELADRAIKTTRNSAMPDSLYKGTLGVAVLASDLLDPDNARMPLFEAEGWPQHGGANATPNRPLF